MSLVSVIVITYNSSKTVEDTLDSIASQGYSELELIVTDDASKDDTVSVVRKWADKHRELFRRVEVVTAASNSGVTANAHRGVAVSQGEWIKVIAGDDMLFPNAIGRFMDVASRGEGEFFFARMELFYDEPDQEVSADKKAFYEEAYALFRRNLSAADQCDILRYSNNFCPAPAAFFARAAFERIGGFDLSIAMAEDMPLWLNATGQGNRLFFIDEPLVKYRIGTGSVQKRGCFAVTKRLIKYKYLLRTNGYGMYGRVKQLKGCDDLSNKVCFMLLKLLSVKQICDFKRKAAFVSRKYEVRARKMTFR